MPIHHLAGSIEPLHEFCGRNGCRPWREFRNDNLERYYIDGQGKDTLPLHPIPKTKPGRLHKSLDTPNIFWVTCVHPAF